MYGWVSADTQKCEDQPPSDTDVETASCFYACVHYLSIIVMYVSLRVFSCNLLGMYHFKRCSEVKTDKITWMFI